MIGYGFLSPWGKITYCKELTIGVRYIETHSNKMVLIAEIIFDKYNLLMPDKKVGHIYVFDILDEDWKPEIIKAFPNIGKFFNER